MLFVGLIMMGYISYQKLPIELNPDVEFPFLIVSINSPTENDPTYLRNNVVIPVEGAISRVDGIEKMTTNISTEGTQITVSFSQSVDIKHKQIELEESLRNIKRRFANDFNIMVVKIPNISFSSQFMTLKALGKDDVDYIRNTIDRDVVHRLEAIDGVSAILVSGGSPEVVEIKINPSELKSLGISASSISQAITKNSSVSNFVGSVHRNNNNVFVNVVGEYLDIKDLGLVVVAPGPIYLKDIADIYFGKKPEESYSRIDGKEVVMLTVSNSPSVNLVKLSERVNKEIKLINEDLELKGINISVESDSSEKISGTIDAITNLALLGGLLAIVILYFFLRNLRIVSLVAFAIPISVLSSFYFFYLADININTITLTGIALAIGMLLDNSIVVMENIFRLRNSGINTEEAVVRGTKEVFRSVFAGTMTTIAVFIPFIFTDNFILKIIGSNVSISVISTLLVSLFAALLLIPMGIYRFMSKSKSPTYINKVISDNRGTQIYMALLKMSIRKPFAVIITSLLLLLISVILSLLLSTNIVSEADKNSIDLYIEYPESNTLERSDRLTRQYEERVLEVEEVKTIKTRVNKKEAVLNVELKDNYEKINNRDFAEIQDLLLLFRQRLDIPRITTKPSSSSRGGGGGGGGGAASDVLMNAMGMGGSYESITVRGQDFNKIISIAERIKIGLENISYISNWNINISRGNMEAQMIFDDYLMGINGLTPAAITNELSSFNESNKASARYRNGEDIYDIMISEKTKDKQQDNSSEKPKQKTLEDLKDLYVKNNKGALTPLEDIASINLTEGKGNIFRQNQVEEVVIVYSFLKDVTENKSVLDEARMQIDELAAANTSTDIAIEVKHDANSTEGYTFIILSVIVLIYMILASIFESLIAPIALMFSIPLAGIGSIILIMLTGNSLLSINALIGFIILLGIVVNNSIILIDYTNILRKRGNNRNRALLTAGLSRVRPILITVITTIIGMLPLAMGKSELVGGLGASFAITVIGGLITSTMLTLVVVPTFYSGLEDILERLKKQKLPMKMLLAAIFITISTLSYLYIDSLILKGIIIVIAGIFTPSIVWFIEGSIKTADKNIIADGESIKIELRNIVKIYGRESKFMREWKSGIRSKERKNIVTDHKSLVYIRPLMWLMPLSAFMIYFGFFYQEMSFWMFIGAVLAWFFILKSLRIIFNRLGGRNKIIYNVIYYLLPLIFVYILSLRSIYPAFIIFLGIIWYIIIAISYLSSRIRTEGFSINNVRPGMLNMRRLLYKLVMIIPLIGEKKQPFKALNSVSFTIENGMFGLLGPNGAGKTTIMRIICGILEQSYGKVFINGIDTQKKREELQGIIGYLPQEFGTYELMTAEEYLDYQALTKGIRDKELRAKRVENVLRAVHMYESKDKRISGFSGGMKQRIGIAQTLLNLPKILVVDEPTAGLDPRERIRFRNLLVELSRNRIVIFSTHIIEDIASSCNKVAVINKGSLKYFGTPMDMSLIAKGITWEFELSAEVFNNIAKDLLIVHHIKIGDNVRVRCLSENSPMEGAKQIEPILEDSYLWLLRGIKIEDNDNLITQQNE